MTYFASQMVPMDPAWVDAGLNTLDKVYHWKTLQACMMLGLSAAVSLLCVRVGQVTDSSVKVTILLPLWKCEET